MLLATEASEELVDVVDYTHVASSSIHSNKQSVAAWKLSPKATELDLGLPRAQRA